MEGSHRQLVTEAKQQLESEGTVHRWGGLGWRDKLPWAGKGPGAQMSQKCSPNSNILRMSSTGLAHGFLIWGKHLFLAGQKVTDNTAYLWP